MTDQTNEPTPYGDSADQTKPGRRDFLRLVAGSALAAPLLAACSGDESTGGTDVAPTSTSQNSGGSGGGSGGGPVTLEPTSPAAIA